MDFHVYACCLDEKSRGSLILHSIGKITGRLHVIHMDVNSQKDVDNARHYVENCLPEHGLWAIVNNADRYDVGFLEWLPVETYETVNRKMIVSPNFIILKSVLILKSCGDCSSFLI